MWMKTEELQDCFKKMNWIKTFIYGILAGACVALGGTVFLSLDNKIIGALFFTVGLFTICTFGFYLFTGKVCYVFERDRHYALDLPVIWLGNLCGAWLIAQVELCTRIGAALVEKAIPISAVKLGDHLLSVFLLSVLCNIMIYIAVEGFSKSPHELGKYLALFFGVAVFILCGFEHCVANMYYFTVAGVWSGKTVLYIFIMTLGNTVGGVILPLLRRWLDKVS